MPPGLLHPFKPVIFTTCRAITAIMAALPAMVANESSKTATARVRGRSTLADFDLRLSNENGADERRSRGSIASGLRPPRISASDCWPLRWWQKGAAGLLPSRPNFFVLAGPGAESALLPSPKMPSGRSQRGDSAWCKTLDHLLSLLMETSV